MMSIPSRRKDRPIGVIIVSASCCVPGMEPFDRQAERVVQDALSETGVTAEVRVVPASKAMFGAIPPGAMRTVMAEANAGRMPMPAVLIGGRIASLGVPKLEEFKAALLEAANGETRQKENSHEHRS